MIFYGFFFSFFGREKKIKPMRYEPNCAHFLSSVSHSIWYIKHKKLLVAETLHIVHVKFTQNPSNFIKSSSNPHNSLNVQQSLYLSKFSIKY